MDVKILSINYDVTPSYKPVTSEADYSQVQSYLYKKTQGEILIPAWEDLKIQHKGYIVVFTEPWKNEVYAIINGKQYCITYFYETGFISDKGSVPTWARSVVDNDSPAWLIPFFNHDAGYDSHGLKSRNLTDVILREMGRYGKENKLDIIKPRASAIVARTVYLALYFGGSSAWKNDRLSNPNIKKYCRIEMVELK